MSSRLLAALLALAVACGSARAQQPSPYAIEIPSWFATTFLDFREDVADAAKDGKRLFVYFGQDGCPYCKRLFDVNFSQRSIVEKMHRSFVAIALNIWGDREITWLDGRVMREKDFARMQNVQFTPTLLFLDERGNVVARLDGYHPPQRFEPVLDYVAAHLEAREDLGAYLAKAAREPASPQLHDEPFFVREPYDLRRKPGAKPLAVVFETVDCPPCDELHDEAFRRPEIVAQLGSFDVARFALGARTPLTRPDGQRTIAAEWARDLKVIYTPTIVFFDAQATEVFRTSAYLRPFHIASALEYVASGAYGSEPSFQRFVQARADRLRARGERVDLWQ
jgi:thioredoxin-related protein